MATVTGKVNTSVSQSASSPPTCFGLPGANGIQNSWSNCNFTVRAVVLDNYRCYIGLDGSVTDQVYANEYYVIMVANKRDWSWKYSGDQIVVPDGAATIKRSTIDIPGTYPDRGQFKWDFSCTDLAIGTDCGSDYGTYLSDRGYRYVGQLQDLGGSGDDKNGYIWLSGTGTYHVDDPIYPNPVRITIPGFLEYLDYYPWAIRKSSSWKSCDRSGGSLTIRKGGSWRDVKNVEAGEGNDDAFYRDGSSWKVAPKIGSLS